MERYEPCARLFSTPFWHYSTPPPEYAVEWALDYEKRNPISAKISNIGGYQSETSDNFLEIPFFETIRDGLQDLPEFIFLNWWLNINRKGDYNNAHHHPRCHLGGVFWIKTPPNSGNIEFTSSYEFVGFEELEKLYPDEFVEKYNSYRIYYFPPVAGDILIFPSHLQHEVKENKSDEDRISVSFNISIKHV